jgi:hypothetical protein
MDIRENIRFNLETLDPNRVMVEVTLLNEMVLGILYFENPKQTWNKKPLLSKKWRCVDAKVEGLYVHGGEDITPKDIIRVCQDLVEEHLANGGGKVYDKPYHYEKENDVIPNGEEELKKLPTISNNDDTDTHEGD